MGPPTTGGHQTDSVRPTVTIAAYPDYAAAQRAVDYLSDNGFPVSHAAIIGTDLRLVEQVLGRMTVGRAALAGAGSGAWFGLFIGLLFAIAHAATGGRRDFSSRSYLAAGQYAVTVDAGNADQAGQLLTRMTWRESGAS
jgi:ABC-type dipeptide/oligopeptide/nickel transport system permease subunit